jgi:tetratricopeptide (TPR) repeat protein
MLVVLSAVAGVLGCQNEEAKLAEFRARAEAHVEQGRDDAAIVEYRNVVARAPNDPKAHWALAQAYLRKQQLGEAHWELLESVRLDPENLDARDTLGHFSLLAGDFEESLSQSEALIEADPENGRAYVLKGKSLEGLDRADEAEDVYLEALALESDDASYYPVVAYYYARTGRVAEAEPYLRKMVEIDPGYISYSALGGFLAQDADRQVEAEELLRKALEKATEEERPQAYISLAGLYYLRERRADAIRTLELGILETGTALSLVYQLALMHRAEGNGERADAMIEAAAADHPDEVDPQLILSIYRAGKGDLEGALLAAEQASAADPSHSVARLRQAEVLVDLGVRDGNNARLAQGREITENVLAETPSNPDARFVMAKIAVAEGRTDDAIAALRAAIEGRPGWARAHFLLGSLLLTNGDARASRAALERALGINPQMLEARRLLTEVYAATNEPRAALAQGELYLRARPQHTRTRLLVAQSHARLGNGDEAHNVLAGIPEAERTADVLYAIGRLELARGNLSRAKELLLQANEERPHEHRVLRSMLALERAQGELDQSPKLIDAAAAENPDDAKIVSLQGTLALVDNDFDGAEEKFKRAVELAPQDEEAYQELASFYARVGRLPASIETYEKLLADRPDSGLLHLRVAILYEYAGRIDLAKQHYEEAIRYDPGLGLANNNLAYLLAEGEGDLSRAFELAQEAKRLMPDSPYAADTLGWVLFKRGIPSVAIGYLREALAAMDPNDDNMGVIRQHLAQAYAANGETPVAIEILETGLEDLDQRIARLRAEDREAAEPHWAGETRDLLTRLKTQ